MRTTTYTFVTFAGRIPSSVALKNYLKAAYLLG